MPIGRTLIIAGVVMIALGVLFLLGDRLPFRLGRLPGDIVIRGKNSVFYFPFATCLLVGTVLSLIFWIFRR